MLPYHWHRTHAPCGIRGENHHGKGPEIDFFAVMTNFPLTWGSRLPSIQFSRLVRIGRAASRCEGQISGSGPHRSLRFSDFGREKPRDFISPCAPHTESITTTMYT